MRYFESLYPRLEFGEPRQIDGLLIEPIVQLEGVNQQALAELWQVHVTAELNPNTTDELELAFYIANRYAFFPFYYPTPLSAVVIYHGKHDRYGNHGRYNNIYNP